MLNKQNDIRNNKEQHGKFRAMKKKRARLKIKKKAKVCD